MSVCFYTFVIDHKQKVLWNEKEEHVDHLGT